MAKMNSGKFYLMKCYPFFFSKHKFKVKNHNMLCNIKNLTNEFINSIIIENRENFAMETL